MLLFNSLTHTMEEFFPRSGKNVSMYVCGITPYDTTHLGHAFTYIFFDVLQRYLVYKGYKVTYTQNVTDINDRDNDILKRAHEQNTTWQKLAHFWTEKFLNDMNALNWIKPTNYLWASQEISSMISLIEQIIKNKYGYIVNGGVYLDISKVTDYGKLSHLNQKEMLIKAEEFEEDVENPHKRNPLDITLWKPSQPNQSVHIPTFKSPWGLGRPGWHIECSAMSISSLGQQIDIHGGGIDLIYPHHENEIAQSESATLKKPFSKYWLHTGIVMYKGQKMSKSLGNLVLISDLLKKYSPTAIRWVLLSFDWHNSWEFTEEKLQKIEKKTRYIFSQKLDGPQRVINSEAKKEFNKLMDHNISTPEVLDYILHLTEKKDYSSAQNLLKILGFEF